MVKTTSDNRLNLIDKWAKKFAHPTTINKIFNGSKGNPTFGVAVNLQRLVRLASANSDGMCVCISCHRPKHWSVMNGGHYLKRDRLATIIEHRNVNAQCVHCNKELDGNVAEYRKTLVELYGEASVQELESVRLPLNHVWNRYELAVEKITIREEIKHHEKRLGI